MNRPRAGTLFPHRTALQATNGRPYYDHQQISRSPCSRRKALILLKGLLPKKPR